MQQLNPQISIIIPVYKVEKYLQECLESVINQTFTDWIAICVDDGSPDNCGKILDKYADKDSRIKVIHQRNQGLSEARNAAYKYVNTPYVMFLDSDDLFHHQALELAYQQIIATQADILWFDTIKFNDSDIIKHNIISAPKSVKIYNNPFRFYVAKDYLFITRSKRMPGVVWNKIYKSEFVLNTPSATGIAPGEDMLFTIEITAKINKLAHLPEKLHFYRQREGSIIHSINYDKLRINLRNEMNYMQKIKNDLVAQNLPDKLAVFDKYLVNREFFKKFFIPFLKCHPSAQTKEYIDNLLNSEWLNYKMLKLKFKIILFLYQHKYLKLSKWLSFL